MKKKIIALLTALALCLGCLVTSVSAETTYMYSDGILVEAIVTNSDGTTTSYYYDVDGNVSYYTDVAYSSWYYEAVNDVTEKGFMTGMGDGKFEPDTPLSRAMFITVLYRMSTDYGNYVDADSGFSDVESGT